MRERRSVGERWLWVSGLVVVGCAVCLPATPASGASVKCEGLAATIVGTPGDDHILGTAAADVIAGLGGHDFIIGLAGDDVICGGASGDYLKGGLGDDRLLGGPGGDGLIDGRGDDVVRGGTGPDVAHLSRGNDLVSGGRRSTLDQVFAFVPHARPLTVNLAAGTATGFGHDHVAGFEKVRVDSAGSVFIIGSDGPNRLDVIARRVVIHGRDGDDVLISAHGNDSLRGGGGDDELDAGFGADTLDGGPGTDTLRGGPGTDICTTGETLSSCP